MRVARKKLFHSYLKKRQYCEYRSASTFVRADVIKLKARLYREKTESNLTRELADSMKLFMLFHKIFNIDSRLVRSCLSQQPKVGKQMI